MQYRVFIHTNHKQWLGAIVAAYSMKRNSPHADKFEVEILEHKNFPFMQQKEGQLYLRDGVKRTWLNDDLQSFTPLRFMPPERMNYQGRSVVVDPDVFAVGDVWELLSRDMGSAGILCRPRSGRKGKTGCLASSVMLLDNAKLTHWKVEETFNQMFEFKVDYMDWICLKREPRELIELFENEWNDFDKLTPQTKMLHTTKRRTQPWKSGLPVDFRPPETNNFWGLISRARRTLFGEYAFLGHYKPHPDPNIERYFFGLVKECLENGLVTEDDVRREMAQNHVRHDALELIERLEPLAPPPGHPLGWDNRETKQAA